MNTIGFNGLSLKKILLDEKGKESGGSKEEVLSESSEQEQTQELQSLTANATDILAAYNKGGISYVSTTSDIVIPAGVSTYQLDGNDVTLYRRFDKIKAQIISDRDDAIKTILDRFSELEPIVDLDFLPKGPEENPSGANGVNGEIDEKVIQGGTGDCWILTGVLALASTEVGRQIIKSSIVQNDDGSVTVNFKGIGVSYTISADEIKKHDTDNILKDEYSNGDNDMLVIELAAAKLKKDMAAGKVVLDVSPESYEGYNEEDGNVEGGFVAQIMYFLTGQTSDTYIGENPRQPNQINLTQDEVYQILEEALENGNVALTFGIYDGTHSAKLTNGKTYRLSLGQGGHALAVTNLTKDTVTFVNPWDSSKEYTMTWEEFAKLGVGLISVTDLNGLEGLLEPQTPEEPTVPSDEPTVPPEEPTVPSEEPTVPPEEPTVPPEEPTVPPEEPTVPPEEPTVPAVKPTDPNWSNDTNVNPLHQSIPNLAKKALEQLNENETDVVRANRISSTIYSLEQEFLSNHYTMAILPASYKDTMRNDLFAHIQEVIGTDNFNVIKLRDLFDSAWTMSAYRGDISNFLTEVYDNFKSVLARIQEKPEYIEIFAPQTETEAPFNTGENVEYIKGDSYPTVYSDGSVHVADDTSDAVLQREAQRMINYLQSVYPDVPNSQITSIFYSALKEAVPASNLTIAIQQVCERALEKFKKKLCTEALTNNAMLTGNAQDVPNAKPDVDTVTKEKYAKAADTLNTMLSDIYDKSHIKGLLVANGCDGVHWLEMEIDRNGNIIFSDSKTKVAYDQLFNEMQTKSGFKASGLSDSEFRQIYNAAWLSVYSSSKFDNNQAYDLNSVLAAVVSNMQKILTTLKHSPEYLTLIQNGSAMKSVTSDNTTVNYEFTNVKLDYGDGNVHLSNNTSDAKYQTAINSLKAQLKQQYVPPLSDSQFTTYFYLAQQDAITACITNSRDIPKGLQVKDGTRHGDECNITLGQMMKLVAYKFDNYVSKQLIS